MIICLMGFLDFLKKDTIGIDPGSRYLRIVKDGELVFNEPMQLTRAEDKTVVFPVNYTICDFHSFETVLRKALKQIAPAKSLFPRSYKMIFSIPSGTSEIEKRAYRDAAECAGAVEVYMIYQSYCSAMAMNLLSEKKDFILIDFGSSKIEMTVFADGVFIDSGTVRMGVSKILRILKNYFRRKYKVDLREGEIESMLTSLKTSEISNEIKIKTITIRVEEILNSIESVFNLVNDEFLEVLERISAHPSGNKILMNGIYFTGGGATIDILRAQIKLDERISTSVSKNPLLDTINGLKIVMADREKYNKHRMA